MNKDALRDQLSHRKTCAALICTPRDIWLISTTLHRACKYPENTAIGTYTRLGEEPPEMQYATLYIYFWAFIILKISICFLINVLRIRIIYIICCRYRTYILTPLIIYRYYKHLYLSKCYKLYDMNRLIIIIAFKSTVIRSLIVSRFLPIL